MRRSFAVSILGIITVSSGGVAADRVSGAKASANSPSIMLYASKKLGEPGARPELNLRLEQRSSGNNSGALGPARFFQLASWGSSTPVAGELAPGFSGNGGFAHRPWLVYTLVGLGSALALCQAEILFCHKRKDPCEGLDINQYLDNPNCFDPFGG